MAVAKRQGRSEDQSEDFRQNKQHSWLSPIKGGAKVLSHGLTLLRAFALSLSPSIPLSLPTPTPPHPSPRTPPLSSLRVFGLACPHALRMDSHQYNIVKLKNKIK